MIFILVSKSVNYVTGCAPTLRFSGLQCPPGVNSQATTGAGDQSERGTEERHG